MIKNKIKPGIKPGIVSIGSEKANINMKIKTVTPKVVVYKDKQTRSQIFQTISENTKLNKSKIEGVFTALHKLIAGHLKKRGSGEFVIPKIGIKIRRVNKKATKKRFMVSPLTGKEVTIAAKPARLTVKLTALKFLKKVVDNQ